VLSDAGVDPATLPISMDLQNVSVRAAVNQLLSPQGLTWIYQDETPIITTKEAADGELIVAVYPVADLVGARSQTDVEKNLGLPAARADSLIELIAGTIATQSWSDLGGPGALASFDDEYPVIVVAQTRDVHDEIAALLVDVRKTNATQQNVLAKLTAKPAKPEPLIVRIYLLKPKSADSPAISPKQLPPLVRSLTDAKQWDREEASIQCLADRLVVRQTRRMQGEVLKVLNQLGVVPSSVTQNIGGFSGSVLGLSEGGGMGGGGMGGIGGGVF
jgi:hypothetical protein